MFNKIISYENQKNLLKPFASLIVYFNDLSIRSNETFLKNFEI